MKVYDDNGIQDSFKKRPFLEVFKDFIDNGPNDFLPKLSTFLGFRRRLRTTY